MRCNGALGKMRLNGAFHIISWMDWIKAKVDRATFPKYPTSQFQFSNSLMVLYVVVLKQIQVESRNFMYSE
jgi:hypothetical protein